MYNIYNYILRLMRIGVSKVLYDYQIKDIILLKQHIINQKNFSILRYSNLLMITDKKKSKFNIYLELSNK